MLNLNNSVVLNAVPTPTSNKDLLVQIHQTRYTEVENKGIAPEVDLQGEHLL